MTALGRRLAGLAPERRALLELLLIEEALAAADGGAKRADRAAAPETPADLPGDPAADPPPAPLSFGQERLWLLDRLEPGNAAYNTAAALRLTGPLDPAVLAASFAEIARRHAVLRVTFREEAGRPVQVTGPPRPVDLPLADLSDLPPAVAEAALRGAIEAETGRAFDLARGPLYRARLYRLAATEHVLLAVLHHAVSDAWSMGVLARELTAIHAAFAAGRPSPLPPLPLQYTDYASLLRERLAGPNLEAQLGYWRERLAGAPEILEVPPDRPRPPVRRFRGGMCQKLLPRELAAAVARLGDQHGATPFMALLAAFEVVLHDRTGATDLVVGVDVANRVPPAAEVLIGFFVNQVVLRVDAGGDPAYLDLLARVRETAIGALAHAELPFGRLVEELAPRRSLARNPLFQVMFGFYNVPEPAADLGGLSVEPLEIEGGTAVFDLSLYAADTPRGLSLMLRYDADLFAPATADALLADVETVVRQVVAAPELQLSALVEQLAAERRRRREAGHGVRREERLRTLKTTRRRALDAPPGRPGSEGAGSGGEP